MEAPLEQSPGRPPSPRRIGRESNDDKLEEASDAPLGTLSTVPTTSWDSVASCGEAEHLEGRRSRQDRRKYIDVNTPTLIDEEDEYEEDNGRQIRRAGGADNSVSCGKDTVCDEDEEDNDVEKEMVSLQSKLLVSPKQQQEADVHSLRRTPGARMHASLMGDHRGPGLRRTPGASDMHQSSDPRPSSGSGRVVSDSTLLGFGLTLSTPVAGARRAADQAAHSVGTFSSSGSGSTTPLATGRRDPPSSSQPTRAAAASKIRNVDHDRESQNYTPAGFTLSKNPHLGVDHGAFSPNTLRLAEYLENILHDVEDERDGVEDSWSKPYVFFNEGGSGSRAKSAKIGRHRRGRSQGGNSSRNQATPSPRSSAAYGARYSEQQSQQPQHGGPMPGSFTFARNAQQPKPVRSDASAYSGEVFSFQDKAPYQGENPTMMAQTQPINFGGAFAPPSKEGNRGFMRPAAMRGHSAATSSSQDQSRFQPSNHQHQYSSCSAASNSGGFKSSFHVQPSLTQQHAFVPHPPLMDTSPSLPYSAHSIQLAAPPYGNTAFGPPNAATANNIGHQHHQIYSHDQGRLMSPPSHQQVGQHSHYMPPQQHHSQHQPLPLQHQHPYAHHGWNRSMMPTQYETGIEPVGLGWQQQGGMPAQRNIGWHDYNGYGMPLAPPPPAIDNRLSASPTPFVPAAGPYPGWHDISMQHHDPYGVQAAMRGVSPTPSMENYGIHHALPTDHIQPAEQNGHAWNGNADYSQPAVQMPRKKDSLQQQKKGGKQTRQNKDAAVDTHSTVTPQRKSPRRKTAAGPQASPARGSRKQGRGVNTSDATTNGDDAPDEQNRVETETSSEHRRAELVESPATKAAFKEFYRKFRERERSSFQEAEDFALRSLDDPNIPKEIHWRINLELADLAKRSNRFDEARRLYQNVCDLQPFASQGWLEYSKLEEECGQLTRCSKILQSGLSFCSLSENLLTRAIKHEEKMGNLHRARQLLARLKHFGIEKVWRTVLEGALLEARAGNHVMSRRVLKYLMHHIPWYGPLYLEAYRLEKDLGNPADALAIVERGLAASPRYGPLWFAAFRMSEALDVEEKNHDLPRVIAMFERARASISRELAWKIPLETAQIMERAAVEKIGSSPADLDLDAVLDPCRKQYAMTSMSCPSNLCWKVWLAGGRMELLAGHVAVARSLFRRANKAVPEKGRATTMLECSRLEEFTGNVQRARAILCKSRAEIAGDWKVWLESVLLEMRDDNRARAIQLARKALEIHSGTGRLWASIVQLRYSEDGDGGQYSSLKKALKAVPKSGEVWCEGGRIHLNPFSKLFDLEEARRHLFFATRFTPQYGDSFIETLRLELIQKWLQPVAASMWEAIRTHLSSHSDFKAESPTVGTVVLLAMRSLLVPQKVGTDTDEKLGKLDAVLASSVLSSLEHVSFSDALAMTELEQLCANADPNYGALWFHCRSGPTDTARATLARARDLIIRDVQANAHVYIVAFIRRFGVMAELENDLNVQKSALTEDSNEQSQKEDSAGIELANWDSHLLSRLRRAPSLSAVLRPGEVDSKSGRVLLESSVNGNNFVTGLIQLNRHKPLSELSLVERRKALFGSDALFSY